MGQPHRLRRGGGTEPDGSRGPPRRGGAAAPAVADGRGPQPAGAGDDAEALQLASARRSAFSALARVRPTTILEDVTVPRDKLAEMVAFVAEVAKKHNLLVGTFGHMGDGNLHPTFLTDERNTEEMARVHEALEDIVTKTLALGGTITGEHGVGIEKRDLMLHQFTQIDLDQQMAVRSAFDADWILNPSKVFPLEGRA